MEVCGSTLVLYLKEVTANVFMGVSICALIPDLREMTDTSIWHMLKLSTDCTNSENSKCIRTAETAKNCLRTAKTRKNPEIQEYWVDTGLQHKLK